MLYTCNQDDVDVLFDEILDSSDETVAAVNDNGTEKASRIEKNV